MSNKSPLQAPSTKVSAGYSSFNMPQGLRFSHSTADLLPCYYDVLAPGERIDVRANWFTRTQELESAAMVDITEHVDYFFVPMKKILSLFGESFIYGIDDIGTTFGVRKENMNVMPWFPLAGFFITKLLNVQPRFELTTLESGDGVADPDRLTNYVFNPSFSFSQGEVTSTDTKPVSDFFGMARLFEMFGISADEFLSPIGASMRLSNAWLNGLENTYTSQILSSNTIDLLPFACYQAVYFDYYRNSLFESNKPWAYNLDYYWSDRFVYSLVDGDSFLNVFLRIWEIQMNSLTPPSSYQEGEQFLRAEGIPDIFRLRQANLKMDYFTRQYSNPLITEMGMLNDQQFYDLQSSVSSYLGTQGLELANSNGDTAGSALNFATSIRTQNSGWTLSGLRSALAAEKILRVTAMNGKHYDDQTLAQFGFKVPKGISNEVYYIGSNHGDIRIGEVVSPSTTQGSQAGEITGKGYGSTNDDSSHSFTAPCHGVFLAIFHADVQPYWDTYGIPKIYKLRSKEDFPNPLQDGLGMQPLFHYEYAPDVELPNNIVGWQPRWMEFKVKYNRVATALRSSRTVGKYAYNDTQVTANINPALRDWTITRQSIPAARVNFSDSNRSRYYLQFFKQSSLDLADIMLVKPSTGYHGTFTADNYVNGWQKDFATDPLITSLQIDYRKSSKMSVYGLETNGSL